VVRPPVLLHAKNEAVIGQQVPMEAEIKGLQKELEEAREKLNTLENLSSTLTTLAGTYRANWINESRRVDALELYGADNAPSSQAGWLSSSPDCSYGVHLNLSCRRTMGLTTI